MLAGFTRASGAQLLGDPTVVDLYGTPHAAAAWRHAVHRRHTLPGAPPQAAQPLARSACSCCSLCGCAAPRSSAGARMSERAKQIKPAEIMDVTPAAVEQAFRDSGCTRMIHGHTHRPARHVHLVDGRSCERWVLSDWYQHGQYLRVGPRWLQVRGARLMFLAALHAQPARRVSPGMLAPRPAPVLHRDSRSAGCAGPARRRTRLSRRPDGGLARGGHFNLAGLPGALFYLPWLLLAAYAIARRERNAVWCCSCPWPCSPPASTSRWPALRFSWRRMRAGSIVSERTGYYAVSTGDHTYGGCSPRGLRRCIWRNGACPPGCWMPPSWSCWCSCRSGCCRVPRPTRCGWQAPMRRRTHRRTRAGSQSPPRTRSMHSPTSCGAAWLRSRQGARVSKTCTSSVWRVMPARTCSGRSCRVISQLFDQRFGTAGRSISLINNPATTLGCSDRVRHQPPAHAGPHRTVMNRDDDVLFLYLTSHGSEDHRFALEFWPLRLRDLDPPTLRQMLDAAGIRWRIIVVSACYSGGFIEPLKDERHAGHHRSRRAPYVVRMRRRVGLHLFRQGLFRSGAAHQLLLHRRVPERAPHHRSRANAPRAERPPIRRSTLDRRWRESSPRWSVDGVPSE